MRKSLVPTVIVDKNNKVTTVYRKDDREAATAAIPAPAGASVHATARKTSAGSLLHVFFPFLRKKAEVKQAEAEAADEEMQAELPVHVEADREDALDPRDAQYQYIMSNLGTASEVFKEKLEGFDSEGLQMISEVIESLSQNYSKGDARGWRYFRYAFRYIQDHILGLGSSEFNALHANREYLKDGVPPSFIAMMSTAMGRDTHKVIDNLTEHWKISEELAKGKPNIVDSYMLMSSIRKAVSSSPEKNAALVKLGTAAINTGVYDDRSFTDSDVPQTFLALLDEFPDKEDRILGYFEQHGPSQFTHDVVAEALGTHDAVSEGWL